MYSRTQNENGTYNTRCLDCFMTIASSVETEEELAVDERRHISSTRANSQLVLSILLGHGFKACRRVPQRSQNQLRPTTPKSGYKRQGATSVVP
jgi:hypothetical protein